MTNPDGRPRVDLTRRERDIVLAILDGCANRAIAQRLGVSERTIRNQLTQIYAKTGVSSRLELALAALQRDLVGRSSA